MARGVCHLEQVDTAVFFPERSAEGWAAKQFCRRCTVQAECLAYALRNDEHFGVWGGESERSRQRMRKARWHYNGRDQGA
jgi:WhiB family transcriptional regulator, redox-sensing transcriptional regulator